MDNFSFLDVRSSIDKSQVSSVKEMILNRAQEKATSLTEEKNDAYTSSVQNDVMSQARASVQANNSQPQFGGLVTSVKASSSGSTADSAATNSAVAPSILANPSDQTTQNQPKYNVQSADNSNYTNSVRDETMAAARSQYTGRKMNLTKTLDFLNTQAAIQTMSKTHSKIV